MEAVTTSTTGLGIASTITNDAASTNSVTSRVKQDFEMIASYQGQITWRYLDGRVCVANEWDGNGSTRMGAITYKIGTIYIGPIVNGEPHGKGCITSTKYTYEGGLQNGDYHGEGCLKISDGTIYIGEFRDNRFHGMGHLKHSDGETYVGKFNKGKKEGMGKSEFEAITYIGEFQNNSQHGFGELSINGNRYVGHFRNGKEDGRGRFTYANGDVYDGQFKNGKLHGKGTLQNSVGCFDVISVEGECVYKVRMAPPASY